MNWLGKGGVSDPVGIVGSDEGRRNAFNDTFVTLHRRLTLFTALALDKLQGLALKEQRGAIGRTDRDGHAR